MSTEKERPPPGTPQECRTCKRPIVWVVTEAGKAMPCDLEPSETGQFYLFRRSDRIEAIHERSRHGSVAKALQRGQQLYTSHFTTCPAGGGHRKDVW